MMHSRMFVAAMACVAIPQVAAAEICAAEAICASNPDGIAAQLQALGYKAQLTSSTVSGNPLIHSASAGYNYDIFFYGCDNHVNCKSLSFSITFEKDSVNSAQLANMWNLNSRFSAMSYDPKDGTLVLSYDVTTAGGLNHTNFADVVSWWETMLGAASKFFADHPASPAPKGSPKPST